MMVVARSVLVDKFKSTSQQTLTQLFAGRPESSPSEDSTDDDVFVKSPKRKRKKRKPPTCSLVTPPSAARKFKRVNNNVGEPAHQGAFVMSTAVELNQPRLLFGDITEGYIFLGS